MKIAVFWYVMPPSTYQTVACLNKPDGAACQKTLLFLFMYSQCSISSGDKLLCTFAKEFQEMAISFITFVLPST
jgi:hypothetical protein